MLKIKKRMVRFLAAVLAFGCVAYTVPSPSLSALAAGSPTVLEFAEHGIKAYDDGWQYSSGGKGELVGDHRVSDCAGLLYAFFSLKGIDGCYGGATSQVTHNTAFSGDLYEGLPRIHGLAVTAPDYYDPGTGIYGHIGIYIGNNIAVDNSTYGVNMRKQDIDDNGAWNAWHLFDNGLVYPTNGWYSMNGAMYHYTNYQYDVNTTVDGYTLGSDGVACDAAGKPIPSSSSMTNSGYTSASAVASHLRSLGYDGKDDTKSLVGGDEPGEDDSFAYNGEITGNEVRLRTAANTNSSIVRTMNKGTKLNILEEVEGEAISNGGTACSTWYKVTLSGGQTGYVSGCFAKRVSVSPIDPSVTPAAPAISARDSFVTFTCATPGANIYYTTDGTAPTASSTPYFDPVYHSSGCTYRAISVLGDNSSNVVTASVFSNSGVFTDVTDKDWFFKTVDSAITYGLFGGTSASTFTPKAKITRGQFVKVLANLAHADLSKYKDTPFSDVSAGSTYAPAIAWAAANRYVSGFEKNQFRPNDAITREQICVILTNYSQIKRTASGNLFADDSKIAGWAKEAVYACRDYGIINGKSSNVFDPKSSTLRAEAAQVAVNFYFM